MYNHLFPLKKRIAIYFAKYMPFRYVYKHPMTLYMYFKKKIHVKNEMTFFYFEKKEGK